MRNIEYIRIGLKDILRQPVRTFLTVTALIISTSLFVALVALGLETRSAITKQLGSDQSVNAIVVSSTKTLSSGFFNTSVQQASQSAARLDDSTVETFSKLKGVKSASPLVNIWEFRQFQVEGYSQSFVAKTSAVDSSEGLFDVGSGTQFHGASNEPVVVLGYGYAEALGHGADPGVLVGKTIRITTQNAYRGAGADIPLPTASRVEQERFANSPTTLSAKVVGVTRDGSNDNMLFIPLGWGRDVQTQRYGAGATIRTESAIEKNGYSNIVVQTTSSGDVRPVTADIERLGYGTSSRQKQIDQINQLSTVMWVVLGSVALISLIGASLGIVNTMLMTISEQRYVIGVWRACGATRSLISRLFIVQAAILGTVAGIIGSIVGAWVSNFINQKIAALLQAQGLDSLVIQPASPQLLAASVALAIVLSVLAGLYPAYKAARSIYV